MTSMENPCVMVALVLTFLMRIIVADDAILTVNVKKPIAIVSEKFLSMTLDPAVLLTGDVLTSSTERSTNMARGLAPAYVRLGGSHSNSYTFERALFPQDAKSDPDYTFSEAHWVLVQQWAEKAGLEVIACIAPQQTNSGSQPPTWDPRNALDLISFSDHMGYNMSWQLGYECQTRCDIPGNDLGKDVLRLRNMLDAFPRYSSSLIAGPDIVTFKSKQQLQYLQDYLNSAGPALSAITWHPDLAGITLDSDGVSLLQDNLAAERDALYKVVGRSIARKPLWIAESKSEECKRQFLGALVWARRLGNSAKLGIQVFMRQPDTSNLFHPTPDYWVSLLHKTLVGREVLDLKVTSGNKTHVHFYCQCTRPSSRYEKGSLTIFGLNLTPSKIVASLKGLKIKTMHKYILMPGYDNSNRMFAETVLLNNEPLSLVNEKDLPELNPVVVPSSKGMLLKLPSGGIGFWVVPGLKVKSCMSHEDDSIDKMLLKKLTKRLEEAELEEDAGHEDEDDQDLYADSTEERKSLIKQKKKKRKHRHSEEEEDERKFRKIDAKKEFEKLEKLLKRRDNNNEERKSLNSKGRVGLLMYDESNEKDNTLEDETSIVQLKASGRHDSGEEIRAKLEEYKNRLNEYENRKKVQEEMDLDFEEKKINSKIEEDSKDVDTQKALEALKLIAKVEQAMKSLDKTEANAQIETLKKEHSNGPISDLTAANSDNDEDILEDELQKSEKTKRMILPKLMIENQLSAILQLLNADSSNKERPEKDAPYDPEEMRETKDEYKNERFKRDLDKLFGEDPLGLRRDSIFKKRTKNEEAKERRMERRNRKKEKEDALTKKEVQAGIFDPKNIDSIENNFFGFQQREPSANFPRGDVFLNTGTSSEEIENDYDYIQDDDDMATDQKSLKKSKKRSKSKTRTPSRKTAEPDDTWVEDGTDGLDHAPNEFYENVRMPMIRINEKLKDYGELWEAESLQKGFGGMDDTKIQATDTVAEEIVKENHLDENMDKRAKETTVKKLLKYYDNSEVMNDEPEVDFSGEKLGKRKQKLKSSLKKDSKNGKELSSHRNNKDQVSSKKRVKVEESEEEEEDEDFGSMQFRNTEESEEEPIYEEESTEEKQNRRRTRRKISDLDSIFNNEMINQDDDNLKDCQCRVIRGGRWADQCKHYKSKNDRKRRDLEEPANLYSAGNAHNSEKLITPETDSTLQNNVEITESNEDEDTKGMDLNSRTAEVVQASPRMQDAEEILSVSPLVTEEKPIVGIIQETHEEPALLTQETPAKQVKRLNKYSESAVTDNLNENSSVINTGQSKDPRVEIVEKPKVGSTFREKSEEEYKEMETNLQGEAGASEKTSTLEMVRVPEVSEHLTESHSIPNPAVIPAVNDISIDNTEHNSNNDNTKYLSNIQDQNEDNKVIEATRETGTDTVKMERQINQEEESKVDEKFPSEATAKLIEEMKSDKDINIEQNRAPRKMTEESIGNGPQVEITAAEINQSSSQKVEPVGSTNVNTNDVVAQNDKVDSTKEKPKTLTSFEDLAKAYETKAAAKSEALTNLRKESEMKKIEVKKVMETAKLKSTENAKYQEYQRKRAEKLEKLKEKLRAKRAKILQQYREELLEALSKCDSEVERNLKRREIWEEMKNHKDLQDVADKEKLAYIMMYKPIDYSSIREESAESNVQERRYIPEVEITRSLPDHRMQRISVENRLHTFQDPKIMHYEDLLRTDNNFENSKKTLQQELNDEENLENSLQPVKSYYAIVESIENPKIFEESLLKVNRKSAKQKNNYLKESNDNFLWTNDPYELEKYYNKKQYKDDHLNIEMDHNDLQDLYEIPRHAKENLREEKNDLKYWKSNHQDEDEKENLNRPLLAIDASKYKGGEPKLEIHDENYETEDTLDDLEENGKVWKKYNKKNYINTSKSPSKKYKNSDSPLSFVLGMVDKDKSAQNSEESESLEYNSKKNQKIKKTSKYKSLNPAAMDQHIPKAFYSNKRHPQTMESLKTEGYLENYKNPIETVKKAAFPVAEIAEIEKYENRIDESVPVESEATLVNHSDVNDESNVRVRRYLAADSNRPSEEPSMRWRPLFSKSKLSKRKERNVERGKCNYMCLKEDSGESSAEDQNRLFKLVKEEDHYKAVPVENVEIKEKYVSKKNLKSSEYSNSRKHMSPKYDKYVSQEVGSEESPREFSPEIVSFRKNIEHRPISQYEINDIIQSGKYNWKDITKMNTNKEYDPRMYKDMNPTGKSPRYVRKDSQEVEDHRQDYKDQSGRISLRNSENHFVKMYDDGDFINKHQDLLVDLPKKYPNGIQVRFHQDEDGPSISNDDDIDSLDLDDALGSSKYELLMLIPVKSHKRSRHRREIRNEITRNEESNNSGMNEVWPEVMDIKHNAKHLQDYIAKRKEHAEEFEKIQKDIDWYLKKMGKTKNKDNTFSTYPNTIEILENKVMPYEHPKSNIFKTTIRPTEDNDPKKTSNFEEVLENSTPTSFLEEVIPKIATELTKTFEKTGNLTNSLESFIDDFQGRFNDTLKNKQNETIENLSPTRKITHNVFNTVITHVNKFFAFISGLARIFHRH
ncbi:uncharacterized protein LOC107267525 [Cephus cinctus]|uniref:Uncharacterized protein LOC107267525 n=1 Tax=Cephus cinctus TaxID=211228 RepID=A0AAJ7BUN1_CEPCN|nr:uncharacterized protein LOC107267525 [Cephus cinctus]